MRILLNRPFRRTVFSERGYGLVAVASSFLVVIVFCSDYSIYLSLGPIDSCVAPKISLWVVLNSDFLVSIQSISMIKTTSPAPTESPAVTLISTTFPAT